MNEQREPKPPSLRLRRDAFEQLCTQRGLAPNDYARARFIGISRPQLLKILRHPHIYGGAPGAKFIAATLLAFSDDETTSPEDLFGVLFEITTGDEELPVAA